MLIILMVAAVISIIVEFFFSEQKDTFWLQGVSILSAVLVVSLVGSLNDYQKQKQFQELNALQEKSDRFFVIRNGERIEIGKPQIVVGDVLLVEGGNEIPADGLVVKAEEIVVDEGSITGEAQEKYKSTLDKCIDADEEAASPIVISGTSLMSGNARVLVLVVGKDSIAGKLNEDIMKDDDDDKQTPLEIKLNLLVDQIGRLGLYSALVVFVALVLRLLISDIIPDGWQSRHVGDILKYLILAISIVVVAIPEGLPLAVTLSLAYSVKKMLNENNLVRKLASCETMGGAHIICTDKTGTLTLNEMSVVEVWSVNNGLRGSKSISNEDFKKEIFGSSRNINSQSSNILLDSLMLNTKAELDPIPMGSSTEIALLKFCKELSPQYYNQALMNSKSNESKVLLRIPFNSSRKRMTSLIKLKTSDSSNPKPFFLHKGGAEIVLDSCEFMETAGGKKPLNRKQAQLAVENMAKQGLRVIALAYKEDTQGVASMLASSGGLSSSVVRMKASNKSNKSNKSNQSEKSIPAPLQKDENGVLAVQKSGFTLQLLVGIKDLPRLETKQAIQDCHRARVLVIMVTGDNKVTARAIADQIGITEKDRNESDGYVRQGKEIEKLDPEKDSPQKLAQFLKNLRVLARSRPEHKLRLVECLRKLNNVVAVTGDGTNDAPALMRADVGFSMGVKGTKIAKNASDIIIQDDRFDSIVRALIWGRNIYESIRKFLQFQLTVNIVACLMAVISSVIIRQSILTAVQMLWVNMIMDSLASLALATQPPNGNELLDRKPFQKREPLITRTMIKHILGQSLYQIAILLILMFLGPLIIPESFDQYDTMIGQGDLAAKYYNGEPQGTVANGMHFTLGGQDNYIVYQRQYGVYSRHFTFIFNTFVLMQFFNFFNCRRIRDEWNIMENPCSNWLYWLIVLAILLLQWIIIQFLNIFFKLYNFGGLTVEQWAISMGIAITVIPVSYFLRAIPFAKPEKDQKNSPVNGDYNSLYDEQLYIKHRQADGQADVQQQSDKNKNMKGSKILQEDM